MFPVRFVFIALLGLALSNPLNAQTCGNALLEDGEQCDDGNATALDGCSASCQVETGWECSLPVPPPLINGVADGGFEAGTPNSEWSEASTATGTPLCTQAGCGLGTGTGPNTGEWWAWFGGQPSGTEDASLEQSVTINAGDSVLTFELEAILCDSASDYLTLKLDGNEVFHIQGDDALCGQKGYTLQTIDLATAPGGPYNDDSAHVLLFEGHTEAANGGVSNFFIDDVIIDRSVGDPTPSVCSPVCFSEDFDPGTTALPAGWTTFNTGALALDWGTSDDGFCNSGSFVSGNFTGGEGVAACVDSDAAGTGQVDSFLCSEAIDLSQASGATLEFLYNYQIAASAGEDDFFEVLVGESTPGPATIATYDTVLANPGVNKGDYFSDPGEFVSLDMSAYDTAVHICFRYGANYDWYAQVDDIYVRAESCTAGSETTDRTVFVPIEPCRIIDTRQVGGTFGGGQERDYRGRGSGLDTLQGGAFDCNIPETAGALQLNFTAVNPLGFGYLRAWPFSLPEPTATLLAYNLGISISNSVAVPICEACVSEFTVKLYGAKTHLVVEAVGYYQAPASP